jgi:hypothetical protein
MIDLFGTPHSEALHVIERYRLIDGEAAAEAQRKPGAIYTPNFWAYGRSDIDPDTAKKGLQVEFQNAPVPLLESLAIRLFRTDVSTPISW